MNIRILDGMQSSHPKFRYYGLMQILLPIFLSYKIITSRKTRWVVAENRSRKEMIIALHFSPFKLRPASGSTGYTWWKQILHSPFAYIGAPPLKFNVKRDHSLHTWTFTVPIFSPNFVSIGTTVSEKSGCCRQAASQAYRRTDRQTDKFCLLPILKAILNFAVCEWIATIFKNQNCVYSKNLCGRNTRVDEEVCPDWLDGLDLKPSNIFNADETVSTRLKKVGTAHQTPQSLGGLQASSYSPYEKAKTTNSLVLWPLCNAQQSTFVFCRKRYILPSFNFKPVYRHEVVIIVLETVDMIPLTTLKGMLMVEKVWRSVSASTIVNYVRIFGFPIDAQCIYTFGFPQYGRGCPFDRFYSNYHGNFFTLSFLVVVLPSYYEFYQQRPAFSPLNNNAIYYSWCYL